MENPYTRLRDAARKWAREVTFPRRSLMWRYPKDSLYSDKWHLSALAERVQAARQLGHDVRLEVSNGDLEVWYVERPGSPPWEIAP